MAGEGQFLRLEAQIESRVNAILCAGGESLLAWQVLVDGRGTEWRVTGTRRMPLYHVVGEGATPEECAESFRRDFARALDHAGRRRSADAVRRLA